MREQSPLEVGTEAVKQAIVRGEVDGHDATSLITYAAEHMGPAYGVDPDEDDGLDPFSFLVGVACGGGVVLAQNVRAREAATSRGWGATVGLFLGAVARAGRDLAPVAAVAVREIAAKGETWRRR